MAERALNPNLQSNFSSSLFLQDNLFIYCRNNAALWLVSIQKHCLPGGKGVLKITRSVKMITPRGDMGDVRS